jgi:acyl-CoA hydrolase
MDDSKIIPVGTRGFYFRGEKDLYEVKQNTFSITTKNSKIGQKIGEYFHCCHIDRIDYIVLLFEDGSVLPFADYELEKL